MSPQKTSGRRFTKLEREVKEFELWAVFPGCSGPLHPTVSREVLLESPFSALFNDLSFDQILSLAYMFNFQESGILSNKGSVKFQFEDSEDWSKSVSLLSVGVNQAISVGHELKGALEVGLKIRNGPGKLAKYTKIVRLTPRFIIVNRIDTTLKVCQIDTFQNNNYIEIEVSSHHARPYHLPASVGDRRICFQIDGWEKSINFNIDQIGIFTLELKRHLDLASIPHVNTRGS
jgi:hypothetical protein